MISFPDPYPNLFKWPALELVYHENLHPQFRTVHLEDVELAMMAIRLSVVEVVFYDHASCRCKILRNHRTLTGRIYSSLTDAIDDISQTYDPPAPEPLTTTVRE